MVNQPENAKMLSKEGFFSGISRIGNIPASLYDKDGSLIGSYQFPYSIRYLPDFYSEMIRQCIDGAASDCVFSTTLTGYPVIAFSWKDPDDDSCYIWGPVAYGHFTGLQQKAYDRMCRASNFTNDIRYAPVDRITSSISILTGMLSDLDLSSSILFPADTEAPDSSEAYSARPENHTIAEETVMTDAIRRGDTDFISKTVSSGALDYPHVIPDNFKNEEYMAVAGITIACRAAISGGVGSKDSLALSDDYLRRLASSRDALSCVRLRNEAAMAFTRLVAENAEPDNANRYVRRAKQYVRENINEPVTLSDIAADLHVNASYLSRVFKDDQGCTLTEYIQRKKTDQAKNILIWSDESVTNISDMLGFTSPSYFAKVFRRIVGCSPAEYRAEHRR